MRHEHSCSYSQSQSHHLVLKESLFLDCFLQTQSNPLRLLSRNLKLLSHHHTQANRHRDTVKCQQPNYITSNRILTCILIINGDFVNCAPCICRRSSPAEPDRLGRAQCLCVLTAEAWRVSGPCQTWSLSPALVSDIKIDFTEG